MAVAQRALREMQQQGSEARLPIWEHKERVLRSVEQNAVSLVYGSTGSGKSTQVPQMLLERYPGSRIVCTQPRRLAAVAIAGRVAAERGTSDEVGYRIGHHKAWNASTARMMFVTAGLLLQQIKQEGEAALEGVAVLVIDEVHERSIESDVLLASVRRLLISSARLRRTTKVVLMSATLDLERYVRYMRLSEEEHVNMVNVVSEQAPSATGTYRRVEEIYLCEMARATRLDARDAIFSSLEGRVNSLLGGGAFSSSSSMDEEGDVDFELLVTKFAHESVLHAAIASIVGFVVASSESPTSTLVFLPTYRALQTQHEALLASNLDIDVAILHSSVELEACLAAVGKRATARSVVVLSTNIAESSVTLPEVVDVIDSCLTNQVVWDHETRTSRSRVVFASKAQCDQRRGRVGRVREGVCWRLVPRAAFHAASSRAKMQVFETPAIKLQALDKMALSLVASKARDISEALLGDVLDPPLARHVDLSLEFLALIDAVAETPHRRLGVRRTATRYGQILSDLPVSLDAARLAVALACRGLARLGALAAAVLSAVPKPVKRPFAGSRDQREKYRLNLLRFSKNIPKGVLPAFDELCAHVAAYEFFEAHCLDPSRSRRLDEARPLEEEEEEMTAFCEAHDLVLSAIREVQAEAAVILTVLHRHRPPGVAGRVPSYRRFRTDLEPHVCVFLENQPLPRKCTPSHQSSPVDVVFARDEIFTLRECYDYVFPPPPVEDESPAACRFFARGRCTRGASCRFSHDASRPLVCPYFLSTTGCRFGNACAYLHAGAERTPPPPRFDFADCVRRVNDAVADSDPHSYDAYASIVLLGEATFAFAELLVRQNPRKRIVATTPDPLPTTPRVAWLQAQPDVNVYGDLDATVDWPFLNALVPDLVVFNFPHAGVPDLERNSNLIDRFFRAAFNATLRAGPLRLHLALSNDEFSRWSVLDVARDNFFYLETSFDFDFDAFSYHPVNNDGTRRTKLDRPVVYEFTSGNPPARIRAHVPPPEAPTCCVCLDVLHDDFTLRMDCSHMVCASCAQGLRTHSHGAFCFPCPLCRQLHFDDPDNVLRGPPPMRSQSQSRSRSRSLT
ncbi:hypothetical protein CTAYLR_005010 [Chrysophaeum taylorii]|uniref:RNA helicase n=1 Tax=Chrysophaeum taylorii TaxID=2483200 RepID=A0AAD7XJ69_9STRA|nr:hypothetical protein CTAYLR_005010 [Chrysophaeum taylorii]